MKTNKVLKGWCILSLVLFMSSAICSQIPKSRPKKDGYVPNAETAIKIAEAIWLPIYGESIYAKKPFKATLKNDVWIIEGTLHTELGGVPYAEIQKRDCKIIKVTHTK